MAAQFILPLLAGIAQGRSAKSERERKAEEEKLNLDYKKTLIKAAESQQKTAQQKEATRQKLLEMIMGQLQPQAQGTGGPDIEGSLPAGGQQSTPLSENFQKYADRVETTPGGIEPMPETQGQGGGLPGVMAMAQMDPMMAALLKAETGIDVLGAQRMGETQRHNRATENLGRERFERGGKETIPLQIPSPDGGKVTMMVPKFGMAGTSFQTKLPEVEPFDYQDESGATVHVIRNKRTGEPLTTPVQKNPPKGAPAESAGKIAMASNAVKYAKQLRDMIVSKDGKINRKLLWQMSMPFGGVGEGRRGKSLFRDAVDARIRAATGAAINAEEIPYYESVYLPSVFDNDATIIDKLNRLDEFLAVYLETMDPQDVIRGRMEGADLGPQLPAAAIKQLKEGTKTTFGNGQTWTVKGGQPVQVQ